MIYMQIDEVLNNYDLYKEKIEIPSLLKEIETNNSYIKNLDREIKEVINNFEEKIEPIYDITDAILSGDRGAVLAGSKDTVILSREDIYYIRSIANYLLLYIDDKKVELGDKDE